MLPIKIEHWTHYHIWDLFSFMHSVIIVFYYVQSYVKFNLKSAYVNNRRILEVLLHLCDPDHFYTFINSSSSSRERVVEGGRKTPRQSTNVQVIWSDDHTDTGHNLGFVGTDFGDG